MYYIVICQTISTPDDPNYQLEWLKGKEFEDDVTGALKAAVWRVRLEVLENSPMFANPHTGTLSKTLGIGVHLRRVFTYHLMQTFLPSIMISLGSVASVFIAPNLVPGRMGLCITACLSMISLFNGSR